MKKTFEIKKEDIINLASFGSNAEATLKKWFPEAFKSELEHGRWLKNDSNPKWMVFQVDEDHCYGFNNYGDWFQGYSGYDCVNDNRNRYATEEEVKTALVKEAEKRGLTYGVSINNIYDGKGEKYMTTIISSSNFNYETAKAGFYWGKMCLRDSRGHILFTEGIWAEIIPQVTELTLEEIAEKFNIDVKQLKIKK